MKNSLIKIAVGASLLHSLAAAATPVYTVYPGISTSDSFTFVLSSISSVTIGYFWSDMLLVKAGDHRYYDASSLGWTLTGPTSASGSLVDAGSVNSASGTLNLGNLGPGSYVLSLFGVWNPVTLSGNGNTGFVDTPGTVDLIDGDLIAGHAESNTFSAIPVTTLQPGTTAPAATVPEPESLALLLAGLGLLATRLGRKSRSRADSHTPPERS